MLTGFGTTRHCEYSGLFVPLRQSLMYPEGNQGGGNSEVIAHTRAFAICVHKSSSVLLGEQGYSHPDLPRYQDPKVTSSAICLSSGPRIVLQYTVSSVGVDKTHNCLRARPHAPRATSNTVCLDADCATERVGDFKEQLPSSPVHSEARREKY